VTVPGVATAACGEAEPAGFELDGPLPAPGVTVLEASAGTGKTFTIAGLVTRFVAEGTPISDVLAVTFTRLATGELRDRVRARLVSAEEGLSRFLAAGQSPSPDDTVLALLAQGGSGEVGLRRQRLAAALTSFDEATITTTHGFCQLMLTGLGVAGDVATGATLLEDPRDVVEEVVDDLYLRWTLGHGQPPSFTRREALEIANMAVANPDTPLEPACESGPGLRRRLGEGVRKEVRRRLFDTNHLTFDDLLVRLRDTLTDRSRGAAAASRLRGRFSVVLVDEFQDTDPIQWEVVRTAFGTGQTRLVLIGDPKQAIYAFRGADVHAYLEAARIASSRFTLEENWRSDGDLLAALDALLAPLRLGHPEIRYRQVRAAPSHRLPGLVGAPSSACLRVRLVPVDAKGTTKTRLGDIAKPSATAYVAADLAADVVALLDSNAEVVAYADDGSERSRRLVVPGDVAVLVATNRQTRIVQQALRAAGVPAVVAGAGSVLATTAGDEWLCLLEAIEQPADRGRAVALALTSFLGLSAEDVALSGDEEWERIHAKLQRWNDILRRRGVAALFRSVLATEEVPARLLRRPDGERQLTDLGHIAQLLHAEASEGHHGPSALRVWLARRIEEAGKGREGAEAEERSRWLDSDADAVQVLTVHRSKGLEFPVVYAPYLWDGYFGKSGSPVVYHDPGDGVRRLDVGGKESPAYLEHFNLAKDEERGEALRELYVALTRARHQAVIWWARVKDAQHSPLGRLLLARDDDGNVATSGPHQPNDEEMRERFEAVARRVPEGLVAIELATGGGGSPWSGRSGQGVGALALAELNRPLDLHWRRTSYSGMTASVHGEPTVGSEPEEPGTTDEPLSGAPVEWLAGAAAGTDADEVALRAVGSLWSDLPGGTDMGTFVHKVLEEVDFAAPELEAEIRRAATARARDASAHGSADALVSALHASITTPLGPLAGGITLSQIGRRDRLDEMGFELPVAGGDRSGPVGAVTTSDIARLFERHQPSGGPLAGYAERLRDPLLGTDLRGYLTGSLDLVFRATTGAEVSGGPPRYFVVDYKTNWIAGDGEPLSAWQYRPAALEVEMERMHYPLQAILYMVALHRYLQWRLPGYTPETHLGGVLYLFLRGMSGPATPLVGGAPCGVFSWRPPTGLVTALSTLLETGS
jgi:exodeoxyribonuclease V beta subunit